MSAKSFPGKNLSNTQTSTGGGAPRPGACARGDRKNPPSGKAQFPGKGLSGTQTKNSRTNRA